MFLRKPVLFSTALVVVTLGVIIVCAMLARRYSSEVAEVAPALSGAR